MKTKTTQPLHEYHHNSFGCAIVDITPEIAKRLLAFNTHNRKLNATTVAQLKADIEAGGWYPTNQGIGFDTEGKVSDGQHRLEAIAAGTTTVRVLIVWGLNPKAQLVIDSGCKRSLGQRLLLAGEDIHPTALGTAHNMLRKEKNWIYKLPQTEVIAKIAQEKEILDYIVEKTTYKGCPAAFHRYGFLTAIAEYIKKSPVKAKSFFEQCVGDGSGICKSASVMRTDLLKPRNGNGAEIELDYRKTLQAIHAFHFGKETPRMLRGIDAWKF